MVKEGIVIYKQADNEGELQQILDLQQRNLPKNLSLEEREQEGFLTVEHHMEVLREMNDACGHIIAKEGEELLGYALCMHPKFGDRIEVLEPMFRELDKLFPKNRDYMVMGQVCVAKGHRGKGVFRGLYLKMKEILPQEITSIITEVDATNKRSLAAHTAIGFRTMRIYHHQDRKWHILQWT